LEGAFLSEYMMLLSSLFMLYLVGLADDLIGVGYKFKFVVQIVAASLILYTGIQPHSFAGVLGIWEVPSFVSGVFAVILFVLMVNAYNLIDGVDGLCSGLSMLALVTLSVLFVIIGLYVYAIMALAMAGIVLAFFIYNVSRRRLKIFMGDTGSLTLGFLITFLCMKFIELQTDQEAIETVIKEPIALAIGMVFVPIFDTIRVFATRIKNKKSPFHPDKIHIHHKLLELGLNHRLNTLTIILAQLCIILVNLVTSQCLEWNINLIILTDIVIAVAIMISIEIKIKLKK
ncbi:MAG: MraY family glycosyltransferase, partial [Rikenellaceae bacterium]